ncbi:hypothetical protein LGQ02_04130 [Bacillus shivajii]|uniref:hypothetical protein n=1 Tax=Bacillus shivajii TaxID=1983719 RepID=UPI001CF936E7|nr:hypothetical protein [Bacillus shivajii]UCZ53980.1 hypothetical protein LGQ02_04130 [Bacillus shivajii]
MSLETTFMVVLFILVGFPLSVFIHEFGHAVGVLLTTKKDVHIFVGPRTPENEETIRIGRCHVHFQWSTGGSCAVVMSEDEWSKQTTLLFFLLGPIFSFVAACFFLFMANFVDSDSFLSVLFFWTGYLNVIMFIIAVIPIKYPAMTSQLNGAHSDGYEVIRLIFSKS